MFDWMLPEKRTASETRSCGIVARISCIVVRSLYSELFAAGPIHHFFLSSLTPNNVFFGRS